MTIATGRAQLLLNKTSQLTREISELSNVSFERSANMVKCSSSSNVRKCTTYKPLCTLLLVNDRIRIWFWLFGQKCKISILAKYSVSGKRQNVSFGHSLAAALYHVCCKGLLVLQTARYFRSFPQTHRVCLPPSVRPSALFGYSIERRTGPNSRMGRPPRHPQSHSIEMPFPEKKREREGEERGRG